LKEGLI